MNPKTSNNERRTLNIEWTLRSEPIQRSMFNVQRSMFPLVTSAKSLSREL
jgi:hypothetical protein